MKKKVFAALIAIAMLATVSTTSIVMAAEGEYTGTVATNADNIQMQNTENVATDYITPSVPESVFDSLWVGDSIGFTYGAGGPGAELNLEVLSGNDVVNVREKSLLFTKEGMASVRATLIYQGETIDEQTYNFTVGSRTQTPTFNFITPKHLTMKIGQKIGDTYWGFDIATISGLQYYTYDVSDGDFNRDETFKLADPYSNNTMNQLLYANHAGVGVPDVNADRTATLYCFANTARTPGTISVTPINGLDTFTLTVEEPVIQTNLPTTIREGNTVSFTTELKNTVLENLLIEDIQPESDVDKMNFYHQVYYQPELEIVEGADLISRENGDYSHMLTASEKLTFNKSGTVKVKVKYNQLNKCQLCEEQVHPITTYNPEQEYTIQVIGKNDSTTYDLPEDGILSKEAFEDAVQSGTEVTFTQKDEDGKVSYAWTFNGKDLDMDKADNLDLSINAKAENQAITKQMQGNGRIIKFNHSGELPGTATLKLYVGDQYDDGTTLWMYYFNEETGKIEPHARNLTVADGYVEFQINHCSYYALSTNNELNEADSGEGGGTDNSSNPDEGKNDKNDNGEPQNPTQAENKLGESTTSPQTGDHTLATAVGISVTSAMAGTVALYTIRKKKKAE